MRNLIISFVLVSTVSVGAMATIECSGAGKDAKVTISILDLATKRVVEGEKNPVAVRVVESVVNAKGHQAEAVLFAGVVNGTTEDVQWFLKSKDRKSFVGTVYMDEAEFTMSVGEREIRFACAQ